MSAGTSFKSDGENVEKTLALGGFDVGFPLLVGMRLVPGVDPLDKFGANYTVETGPEDVIEQGGRIQYDAVGTAPIKYVSSSSALDTGQEISVQGLDINGDFVDQTITTNGQSNVTLDTPLWRQFRMENNSDSLDIQGVLYCHTDETPTAGVPTLENTRTIITGANNQTLFGAYTVPRGKVGFLIRGELGVELSGNAGNLAEFCRFHYESRRYGKIFKIKKSITCIVGGQAVYQDARSIPDIVPALTDIRLTAVDISTSMGVWGTLDMYLIDEGKFSTALLTAIGQPGY